MQYRTTGGKLKKCDLTLHWPEELTFSATATSRLIAERKAAALACMKLKVGIIFGKTTIPLPAMFRAVLKTCIMSPGPGAGAAG